MTRQQETFRALMNNYDEVKTLAGVAADSIGSASKRMETYTESVEAKTNKLKATWEEFVMSLNQSESYKNLLDFLMDVLNNMPIFIGYLTSILTLIIAFKSQKIISSIVGIGASIKELIIGTGGLKTSITALIGIFTGHTAVVKKDTLATIENIVANKELDMIQKKHLISKQLVISGWKAEDALEKANIITKNGQIAVTKTLTTSTVALQGALSAVAIAVSIGVTAFSLYSQHLEKIKEQSNNLYKEKHKEAEAERSKAAAIEDAKEKYKEIYETTLDYEERQRNLSSLNLELKSSLGEVADGLNLVEGSYDKTIKKMDEYAEKQKKVVETATQAEIDAARGRLGQKAGAWSDIKYTLNTPISTSSKMYKDVENIVGSSGGSLGSVWNRTGLGGTKTANVMELDNNTSAQRAMEIIDELQAYYEEHLEELTSAERAAIQGFITEIKNTYGEDVVGAYEVLMQENLKRFKEDNKEIYNNYEKLVKEIKDLKQKYDNASYQYEKDRIKKQLNDLKGQYEKTYDELTKGASRRVKNSLANSFNGEGIDDFLNFGEDNSINWEKIGTTSSIANGLFTSIKKQIQETGTVTDETYAKISTLWDLLCRDGNGVWLQNFINQLESLGVIVPTEWRKIADSQAISELIEEGENGISQAKEVQGEIDKLKKDREEFQKKQGEASKKYYNAQKDLNEHSLAGGSSAGLAGIAGAAAPFTGGASLIIGVPMLIAGGLNANATQDDAAAMKSAQDDYNTAIEEEKKKNSELAKKRDEVVQTVKKRMSEEQINTQKFKELVDEFNETDNVEDFYNKVMDYVTEWNQLQQAVDRLSVKDTRTASQKMYDGDEKGTGSSGEFKNYLDDLKDVQTMQDKLADGKVLDYSDLEKLRRKSAKLRKDIDEDGKVTTENLQEYIDDTLNTLNDDLDEAISMFEDAAKDIEKIFDGEELNEILKNTFSSAAEDAAEDLEDGTLKIGNVDIDATDLRDVTDALDGVAQAKQRVNEQFSEEEKMKIDNTLLSLIAMNAEFANGANAADLMTLALGVAGEGGLNEAWNMLGEEEQEALINSNAYDHSTINPENKAAILQALAGNWTNLGDDEKRALEWLMSYFATYSEGDENAKKELDNFLGEGSQRIVSLGNYSANEARFRKGANITTPKSSGSKGSGSKGSSSKNNYTPEDAAEDLKGILNDIEDYERDIEADLQDQTEELINHYNLEKNKLDTLKEELDYYDNIYDVTEKTTKWLETQMKILDEESKKVAEMQNSNEKIMAQRERIFKENSGYNVASWFDSEMNETLAYGDLLNSFEYRIEEVQKETAQKMRDVYNGVANSTDKDTIAKAKEKIKNIEDEGDLRVKELEKEKEKVENIYDSVEQLNDAWKDNRDAIRDALQELNERVLSVRDELIDDIMEQLERAVDKMNTSIEKDVTRLEQLKTIQESYNSILNDTIETQQSLDDELRANLDTYQYLDEEMRQLMFNEDDYKQLSGVLEGVQQDIANIWEDHYNQIQDLTEEEMYKAEYITNETERQLAAKEKEYALAKAELEVAKAQTQLDNVLNERNTRIFANGEWSWVANPDAVKSARQQLADAEREKTRIEREAEQQQLIDAMDKIIDSDNLQIDKNNDLLERIQEAIERETEEVKSIEQALTNAEGADLPALNTLLHGALGSDGGYMKELLGEINHSQKELAMALRGQTISQAVNQLKSGKMSKGDFQSVIDKLGYSFNETTGMVTTQDGSFAAHYSGWTKKSNADTQLTTAPNGVQVTGTKAQSTQTNSSTTSIASAQAKASTNNLEQIAKEVWQGKWGNGQDRKNRLAAAGYDYAAVQALVNKGRNYFFDQGGVASGIGLLAKDTTLPERVLSPSQTRAFEGLMKNLTTNPVLNALSKIPMVSSKLGDMMGETNNNKVYNFSNFTVQADNIKEFINSIETIMPTKR